MHIHYYLVSDKLVDLGKVHIILSSLNCIQTNVTAYQLNVQLRSNLADSLHLRLKLFILNPIMNWPVLERVFFLKLSHRLLQSIHQSFKQKGARATHWIPEI